VRRGLETTLREIAHQEAKARAAETASDFGTVISAHAEKANEFLRRFVAELEREKVGPSELGNFIALIDWRFLRRGIVHLPQGSSTPPGGSSILIKPLRSVEGRVTTPGERAPFPNFRTVSVQPAGRCAGDR
jgi:hypothetical protein